MFDNQGLSLEQAPPIKVVFTLFAAALLWALIGGIAYLLFAQSKDLDSAFFIHIWTLGIMGNLIFGALFQMLPVIAGVAMRSPWRDTRIVVTGLNLGLIALLYGFVTHYAGTFWLAATLLSVTLLYITLKIFVALYRFKEKGDTAQSMMYALGFIPFVLLSALLLIGILSGVTATLSTHYTALRFLHPHLGLWGWMGMLIVAVALQVVPMFYVTPAYPKRLHTLFFAALLALLLFGFMQSETGDTTMVRIVGGALWGVFGLVTLWLLRKKRRALWDASAKLWALGAALLLLQATAALVPPGFTQGYDLSLLLFALFVHTIAVAMLLKIIPFLTWFHLNAQGYFDAPMMHDILSHRNANRIFYLHLTAILLFMLSRFVPTLQPLAAIAMLCEAVALAWLLYRAVSAYRHTQKHGMRMTVNG